MKTRILKVLELGISEPLGNKLTWHETLKPYNPKYVTRDVVRPTLKRVLGIEKVTVPCKAAYNEEKQQLEWKLTYKGKDYQWFIKEA